MVEKCCVCEKRILKKRETCSYCGGVFHYRESDLYRNNFSLLENLYNSHPPKCTAPWLNSIHWVYRKEEIYGLDNWYRGFKINSYPTPETKVIWIKYGLSMKTQNTPTELLHYWNFPMCKNCFPQFDEECRDYIKGIETERLIQEQLRIQRLDEERKKQEEERRKQIEIRMRMDLHQASNYETALRYGDAIMIYERYGMWEEAGKCRRLQQQQDSPQLKIDIGSISHSINHSTNISDSVIQRSSIGETTQNTTSICPYCAKELHFPETPRYCPYCRKQILM